MSDSLISSACFSAVVLLSAFRARKRISVPYDQRNSPKLSVAPPPDPAEPPASVGLGGEEKTKASSTVNDVPKTSKLIIHHLENSRSQRILWLLVCSPFATAVQLLPIYNCSISRRSSKSLTNSKLICELRKIKRLQS